MKDETMEVIETALCIWEWYLEGIRVHLDTSQAEQHDLWESAKMRDEWREAEGGTPQLRSGILELAEVIESTTKKCEDKYGPIHWNKPFDWEIVPWIMDRYLEEISKQGYLCNLDALAGWTCIACESDHSTDIQEFEVHWSKAYRATGVEKVYAPNPVKARLMVEEQLGDLEGSLQYYPDEDEVEVVTRPGKYPDGRRDHHGNSNEVGEGNTDG
jgi:hypothetical protein